MRGRRVDRRLSALEWTFLLAGLVAIDSFIWIVATGTLFQANENRTFDQELRAISKAQSAAAPHQAHTAPKVFPARLEIPRLNLRVMVNEGADEQTLSRAVGHIPGTGLPGVPGNVGLAGHRDTFFRPLRQIRANDLIELQTTSGTYRYMVNSTSIVTPRDVGVLQASGGQTLTLVTCYPFYYVGSAPKRFIVHATVVPTPQAAVTSPPEPQPGS